MKEELRTEDLEKINGGIRRNDGNCPVCGSGNIESEYVHDIPLMAFERKKCMKCGKVWTVRSK